MQDLHKNMFEMNQRPIKVIQEDAEVLMTNIELSQKSSSQLKKIKTPEEIEQLLIDLAKKKNENEQLMCKNLQLQAELKEKYGIIESMQRRGKNGRKFCSQDQHYSYS